MAGARRRVRAAMEQEPGRCGVLASFIRMGSMLALGPAFQPGGAKTEVLFPTDLASFLDLIRQHGDVVYSLMFAYAASHSLLLALFGGYAAHSGALDIGTLIVACGLGSFVGDVVRFWIGRRYGHRLLASYPRFQQAAQTVSRLADRHYVWMILVHRYPHGIRGVAGFAYGLSRMGWLPFLALNFVAAGLWSGAIVSAGYAFGRMSETLMSDASSGIGLVMLVIFLGLSWFLSRQLERAIEAQR
jgi:membrane protein DedA with SNARE-associated domain